MNTWGDWEQVKLRGAGADDMREETLRELETQVKQIHRENQNNNHKTNTDPDKAFKLNTATLQRASMFKVSTQRKIIQLVNHPKKKSTPQNSFK